MKNVIVTLILFAISFSSYSQIIYPKLEKKELDYKILTVKEKKEAFQINTLDEKFKKDYPDLYKYLQAKAKEEQSKPTLEPTHRIAIEGLGNISNSQNGQNLSPSANVFVQMLPIKNDLQFKLYVGFNLGSELDSTRADSIKLGSLFLPDRGKSGYITRIEYDLIPLLFKSKAKEKTEGNYQFTTQLAPFIEYNFHKINIRGAAVDSSKIQSSTWMAGFMFSHAIHIKEENTVGIIIQPFYKWVTITDGSIGVYRNLFKETLKGNEAPQSVQFFGVSVGLQINRFQFSFVFEDLKTKSLNNTPLWGGVYTLKATVIGELLKL